MSPTTQHTAAATQHTTATVECATAITQHKAVTNLYSLAMDCLRLSMHFFHPIQQCAQQIYHSALPLSPTSSHLRKFCLQNVIDNQLSYVTAFSGAPSTWGSLLRTIDIRPHQLTCITTFAQSIATACEDLVNIYDAVTFVLQQSLCAPETVAKIQNSPDGSILFFAHSHSVTLWDVQTGGLIHTFTTQSKVNDIALSATGDCIACASSDGSVTSWNIHTKEEYKVYFMSSQPAVAICWLSTMELIIATRNSVSIGSLIFGSTPSILPIPGCVWGIIYLDDDRLLVGTSLPCVGGGQEPRFLEVTSRRHLGAYQESRSLEITVCQRPSTHQELRFLEIQQQHIAPHEALMNIKQLKREVTRRKRQPQAINLGQLMHPIRVGNEVVCITPPRGVQLFDAESHDWTKNPPLLDAATSVAVSLNRNLVAQARDSIQIFSLDVLKTGEARDELYPSHIYPLGEKHVVCLQPSRHLTILELESLRKLRSGDNTSSTRSLLANQSPCVRPSLGRGLVAELSISAVMQAWQWGTPLPEQAEVADGDEPALSGLSPRCTLVVTVYGPPRQELHVKYAKGGITLAKTPLEHGDLGPGEVYDLAFDSETRFHLKMDGPGWHAQVPYEIIAPPSGIYSHAVIKGEPVLLPVPREIPPYTLDANCEWVLDAQSRKICWISPGNVRRGDGGHFWAGLSLVMVGDDGVVRKVSFKEPDC